ncbi:malto-oligosyltrehalose synthase [Cupriavidus pauculus]|uniref:malto-oligosyltrehalose synthase n=1 Tax=Cupriavidus pauculus TaxID=82633 RepID=UPI00203EB776|nr:malto-oligosyltrehalose synthase [Cupriavidus pauculus]MCM3605909.1 malto-oligosyltrehalose synthase [Cupriavidus pauculus]
MTQSADLDHAGVPRATARLQLHAGFTFANAADLVPYYAGLGVSHLYLSPITTARPGSTHGYDVTDFTRINPELGGEAGFLALAERARAAGLGIVLDIVPNHMAADAMHNAWWRDVLARGAQSPYAHYFDIDWQCPDADLRGKVVLPILGEPYWNIVQSGALTVQRHDDGAPSLRYGDLDLPLCESSVSQDISDDIAHEPEALHRLLEQQHYRLTWWRAGAATLNYRRFFEITDLAGVREECEDVFEAVHALVFRLYREGWIDGVRIDHVDGLADPAGYCRRVRARLDTLRAGRPAPLALMHPWLVVEKILGENEPLPRNWQTDGTTGYDFMDEVSAVMHDLRGEARLNMLWMGISGSDRKFCDEVRAGRHRVLARHLVAEVDALCTRLHDAARAQPITRDLSRHALHRALSAFMTAIPVYRSYYTGRDDVRALSGNDGDASAGRDGCADDERDATDDDNMVTSAANAARAHLSPDEAAALDFIVQRLRDDAPLDTPAGVLRTKLQQLMPALAAKSTEDTAFYRYGRLLSRNEVGSDPGTLAMAPARFHDRMAARRKAFAHAMLAVATHDHKRGEDARMRLAVLSELPDEWADAVASWEAQLAPLLIASPKGPDGVDRLMLYQTLVGAWPADPLALQSEETQRAFVERILAWQRKSIREAKRHGSWTHPDEEYEAACEAFLPALASGEADSVLERIGRFAARIGPAGALNSLAQTLLQLTAPGVPDRYQGNETWDFSLVDPDNRRAPDYARLQAHLECRAGWAHWLSHWQDGRIKQQLIRSALKLRQAQPDLFAQGSYTPLSASGELADNVLAFARQCGNVQMVVAVTRLAARHVDQSLPRVPPQCWRDTGLHVGDGAWTDALTGHSLTSHAGWLRAKDMFATLPVALLMRESEVGRG